MRVRQHEECTAAEVGAAQGTSPSRPVGRCGCQACCPVTVYACPCQSTHPPSPHLHILAAAQVLLRVRQRPALDRLAGGLVLHQDVAAQLRAAIEGQGQQVADQVSGCLAVKLAGRSGRQGQGGGFGGRQPGQGAAAAAVLPAALIAAAAVAVVACLRALMQRRQMV